MQLAVVLLEVLSLLPLYWCRTYAKLARCFLYCRSISLPSLLNSRARTLFLPSAGENLVHLSVDSTQSEMWRRSYVGIGTKVRSLLNRPMIYDQTQARSLQHHHLVACIFWQFCHLPVFTTPYPPFRPLMSLSPVSESSRPSVRSSLCIQATASEAAAASAASSSFSLKPHQIPGPCQRLPNAAAANEDLLHFHLSPMASLSLSLGSFEQRGWCQT